jgi:hypothetical protein
MGGWNNPKDGMVYLDVSTIVDTAEEAQRIGHEARQLSYFDMALGKSVDIVYAEGELGHGHEEHKKAAREAEDLSRGGGPSDVGESDRLDEVADWKRSHTRGDRARPSLVSRVLNYFRKN